MDSPTKYRKFGKTHRNLECFKKWVNVDVGNTVIKSHLFDMIEKDSINDSPTIVRDINSGKYSPYKKYLSNMANAQLYCMKIDHMLGTSAFAILAAVRFKRSIRKRKEKCVELEASGGDVTEDACDLSQEQSVITI